MRDIATGAPARPIRLWFRGRLQALSGFSPTRTLLQWLREDQGACGSKEGCNEGDCGACTVVLGERDEAAPGGLRLKAVNACIQFLPTLDGKAVFTVEDLALNETLHPVQQAMVECHAAQCGFCTPGFVMSLWADYEMRAHAPSRAEAACVLSGNLCRCTGYRPILEAALAAHARPRVSLARAPIRAALDTVAAEAALDYQHAGQRLRAPRNLAQLAAALAASPGARLLAGATDIGLWVNKQQRELDELIYLGAVGELKSLSHEADALVIGAAVTLEDAFAAIIAAAPQWAESWRELAARFASPPIRNVGTLAGNLANASPIGDAIPALIALGARIRLQHGAALRELALEDFYLAYQRTALRPGEFVRAIVLPLHQALFRCWKLSKRRDQDISALCAAFALELEDGHIRAARVACGGMAATVQRAPHCEAALRGQAWNARTLAAAQAALAQDYTPLSDLRASAAYRLRAAQNLLHRLWHESAADAPGGPSRIEALR